MIKVYSGSLMKTYISQDFLVRLPSSPANDVIGEVPAAYTDSEWLTLIPMFTRLMVMSLMYLATGGKNSLMTMAIMEIDIGRDEEGLFTFYSWT